MSLRTIASGRLVEGQRVSNLPEVAATPGGSDTFLRADGEWGSPINTFTTYVSSEDDFPAAVGLVITLVDGGDYRITQSFSTANVFKIPDGANITFTANLAEAVIITYTGTATFFIGDTDAIGAFEINAVTIKSTGVAATLWDIQPASFTANSAIVTRAAIFTGWDNMGSIKNLELFIVFQTIFTDNGDTLTLDSLFAFSMLQSSSAAWQDNAIAMFTFSGTWTGICELNGNIFVPGASETAFDIDSGATILFRCSGGAVDDTLGDTFAAGSKTQASVGVKFAGVANVQDSHSIAQLSLTGNTTATSIANVDEATLVTGTWTDAAERFTTTAAGRACYIGLDPIQFSLQATVTAVLDSGVSKDVTFCFGHGNLVTHAITAFADAGGGDVTVTCSSIGLARHAVNGQTFKIEGTTNYDGNYVISNLTATTFDITATWVSDDATGDWIWIIAESNARNQIASTTRASNTGVISHYDAITEDFFELYVENNTDDIDIVITDANILINE